MIYDWTITSGGAVREIQKLLKDEFQQNIEADGGIGSLTVNAINSVEDQSKLFNRISEIRKEYYTDLAYNSDGTPSKNFKFLKGWLNRVDDCLNYKL
ncbi:putative peptidoglycan-binding domain-containing protein [Chryseobacterium sp.]|uniref:putative peptidoglycan-binding domain-containing protein n=1 Tax=Chryseobacterium sp. TaxID=1871047 RepID=UPI00289D6E33|nr:putative peptidoglycan-binding domain-containing protein [Chryseobacterium sp.]